MTTNTTTLGNRVKAARTRRRLSQDQLAAASGVHIGTLRKIEQGQRLGARYETVAALATALDVPINELTGVQPGLANAGQGTDVATVRAAIYDHTDDHEPANIAVLRQQGTDMRRLYWQARYTQLAEMVPSHLAASRSLVRAATSGDDRRAANAVLAEALKQAASLVTHLSYEDLAHVALLEARHAAEAAEDPLLIAANASTTAWVLSRQGFWQQAQTLATEAAREIEPVFSSAPPEQIGMWGQLLHFGMVALAREHRTDEAHELLGLVRAAGEIVGDRLSGKSLFSGTFAAHSAVQLAQATGQPRDALRAAQRVEAPDKLPPHVHARYLLNLAWAQTLEWKSEDALETLRRIEALTPELLDHHGLARQIVEELMPRRRTQKLPGLKGIAERMGVVELRE